MEEILTVYANPPAITKNCIDIPFDRSKPFSSILCGVYNASDAVFQEINANLSHIENVVPIHKNAREQIEQAQKNIIEAKLAHLKLMATESTKLDAHQQQVKKLIEDQKISLNHRNADLEIVRNLQTNLHNKMQVSLTKQREISNSIVATSVQSTQAQFRTQMEKSMASMQLAGDLLGKSRAFQQAKKIAEKQRQEDEHRLQELARENEKLQMQLLELQKNEQEIQRYSYRRNFELEIIKSQYNSAETHQQAVKSRHEEAAERYKLYDKEIHSIKNLVNIFGVKIDSHSSVAQKDIEIKNNIITLKEKAQQVEQWLKEVHARLALQQSHPSMINHHFDHCINDLNNSDLEPEPKERLIKKWDELRHTELNNKKIIISGSELELSNITHIHNQINECIVYFKEKEEQLKRYVAKRDFDLKIIKSQYESEEIHHRAVKNRHEEAAERNKLYNNEIDSIKNLIDIFRVKIYSHLSVTQKDIEIKNNIFTLKEKAQKVEQWLNETHARLALQQSHLSMINHHFDHCINDVNNSDLEPEPKERLIKKWDQLRHTELNNKKIIISRSELELINITNINSKIDEYIAYSKEKSAKVDSLINKLSFLNTKQQTLKKNEVTNCETLVCDLGTQAKWASIEASQTVAFAGGMAAGIPAELNDTVNGIIQAGMHYSETYAALKALVNSGDVLGNVSEAMKDKWVAHLDEMVAAQERGGVAGYFEAGVEGGKLVTDVASLGAVGVGAVKVGKVAVQAGVLAGAKIASKAESWIARTLARYPTVKLADTGIKWGYPIDKQGLPWEKFLEPNFTKGSKLTKNFQAFDFYDPATRTAISAKTMNTLTTAKIAKPQKIFGDLKKYVDDAANFKEYKLGKDFLSDSMIKEKELRLAVPATTNESQWLQIERVIAYGESKSVKVLVTRVE
ncbi:hypothetical protein [Sodalis sp. RH19]|uniref:endonuclease toxin domain-containing protein n=1 Tax=Sodalis sp. RH19 TaxID=3394334 RepID=UPI0039B492FA